MSLFIATHLGLGDMILQNGLVRFLSEEVDHVVLPCLKKYLKSVIWMFRDLQNVEVVEVQNSNKAVLDESSKYSLRLLLGHFSPDGYLDKGSTKNFDEMFYLRAGVPFSNKWLRFHVDLDDSAFVPGRFVFIHDDPGRNMTIDRSKIHASMDVERVVPKQTDTIWEHWGMMRCAEELHLINSSFMCWADCAQLKNRRVAHLYAKPLADIRDDITRMGDWTIA